MMCLGYFIFVASVHAILMLEMLHLVFLNIYIYIYMYIYIYIYIYMQTNALNTVDHTYQPNASNTVGLPLIKRA